MLHSRAEAEDVVQDVYLRWHRHAAADVQSPIAFLITTTTRLCLDRVRSLRQRPVQWIDGYHPEAMDEAHYSSPDVLLESRDTVSMAFVAVLECLGTDERTVFLLHDVFDYEYREVAHIVGKSEASCRQIVHRARERLHVRRRRFAIPPETRERLVTSFFAAVESGDRRQVMALVAEQMGDEIYPDAKRGAMVRRTCMVARRAA
jgi:RNA polymerase sigma-70 factor (ECF subfamily)